VVVDLGQRISLGAAGPGGTGRSPLRERRLFQVLGADLAVGRPFAPDEDQVGAPRAVAVLTYRAWQNRFGGDPAILDRPIHVDDVPFPVVGVTGESFEGVTLENHDLWLPVAAMALVPSQREQAAIGRMTPPPP
jgi:hypothetical protein